LKTFHKNAALYLLTAAGLYGLSIPFINKPVLRIATVLCMAFFPCLTFLSFAKTKKVLFAREQLKSFLEQLCVKVSAGKSLETVFLESREDLLPVYGEKAILCTALKVFEDQIASGVALDDAILSMSGLIPCPEAAPLFHTISRTRPLGNRILQVLRQSLLMVGDLLMVTKDISADVSQKRLESTIMSIMPFAVLWSLWLSTPSYLDSAFTSPLGGLLMLFAFCLSVTGYCLGGFIVSRSVYSAPGKGCSSSKSSISMLFAKGFSCIIKPYPARLSIMEGLIRLLPEGYCLSLKRTLSYLSPNKKNVLEEYMFIKMEFLILILFIYISLCFFIPIPFPVCAAIIFLLFFLHDLDTGRLILSNKAQMMQDFPTFVGLLSTLLCNGIVLSKALLMCIETFKDSSIPFQNELIFLRGMMTAGTPCYEALESFANRCQIPEIACALQFAAQYDKSGGQENLNFLKLQCSACWIQSKISARRQLEESSVKLLLPMILQLICVMIITITPSLLSIQQIP